MTREQYEDEVRQRPGFQPGWLTHNGERYVVVEIERGWQEFSGSFYLSHEAARYVH